MSTWFLDSELSTCSCSDFYNIVYLSAFFSDAIYFQVDPTSEY